MNAPKGAAMKPLVLALSAACLALVVAACGSGGGAKSAGRVSSVPLEPEPPAPAAAVPVDTEPPAPAATGPTVPPASARVGFIGLPPEGATPSTPESGELVIFYWGPAPGNWGKGRYWVYADGRLIFLREADLPEGANRFSTGFLEQRLTPEGVELLRSEVVSTDQPPPGSTPVPSYTQILVRDGDRLVRVDRVFDLVTLVARLTDPASWLPASAWEDREIRAYVPSRYAVCLQGTAQQPIEPSRILTLLPAPVEDLLRARGSDRFGPPDYCSDVTTEEARALAEALDDAGLEQLRGGGSEEGAESAYYRLAYRVEAPVPAYIFFEPILPHGEWTCAPCG